MGRLAEMTAQLEAMQRGEVYKTPEAQMDSSIQSIVEAIRGIQLNIEDQEGYDYTPEIQRLGEAVKGALKAHGDDLVTALSKITVNVEAPSVSVEAPQITNEVNIPKSGPIEAIIFRDEHEKMSRLVLGTPEEMAKYRKKKAKSTVEID